MERLPIEVWQLIYDRCDAETALELSCVCKESHVALSESMCAELYHARFGERRRTFASSASSNEWRVDLVYRLREEQFASRFQERLLAPGTDSHKITYIIELASDAVIAAIAVKLDYEHSFKIRRAHNPRRLVLWMLETAVFGEHRKLLLTQIAAYELRRVHDNARRDEVEWGVYRMFAYEDFPLDKLVKLTRVLDETGDSQLVRKYMPMYVFDVSDIDHATDVPAILYLIDKGASVYSEHRKHTWLQLVEVLELMFPNEPMSHMVEALRRAINRGTAEASADFVVLNRNDEPH